MGIQKLMAHKRLAQLRERLDAIRREQERQYAHLGERLGVVVRLRELEREERRVLDSIQSLVSHGAES